MTRRIATYERVSSDDQRERATILTQYDELQRRLGDESDIEVAGRYVDDGVSGTTELKDRPDGRRLLADARAGKFDEVWVYRLDRLGRDEIDPLVVKRDLASWGVKLVSLRENIESPLAYGLQVLLAAEERRTFLERSADGMARAAREGRYCGGIVPYGYRVDGLKAKARLMADTQLVWGEWSAADVVRQIFEKVGAERWSCFQVADWLNALAIPTHYLKDGREVVLKQKGKRAERTSGEWRPSRVRAILTNRTYKGEYVYGKNPGKDHLGNRKQRELIVAACEALVGVDLWEAAQRTLADRRLWDPSGPLAVHLLRSRVKCGICGLSYSGAVGVGKSWYRCNGRIAYRRRGHDKCPSRPLDGDVIEPQILDDIRRWLRNPDEDLLDELRAEMRPEAEEAVGAAERLAVEAQLARLAEERSRLVQSVRKGTFTDDEVASDVTRIREQTVHLKERLAALQPEESREPEPAVDEDVRERLRAALDAGLTRAQLQELVGLLVKQIVVYTEPQDGAKASLRVVVEYNFPLTPPNGAQIVAETGTGTGSGHSRGRSSPGRCKTFWRG